MNNVKLAGTVTVKGEIEIGKKPEKYIIIEVTRPSGVVDKIKVVYDPKLDSQIEIGSKINVLGKMLSGPVVSEIAGDEKKNRLLVYIKIEEILQYYKGDVNYAEIGGYVAKIPNLRIVSNDKHILDLILSLSEEGRTIYVPTVLWNEDAKNNSSLPVGRLVSMCGWVQSREYAINTESKRTVVEISCKKVLESVCS